MDRAILEGVELEYEERGTGEPVLFVHHGPGVDWFKPFLDDRDLTSRYRVITYHRAGYAGSSPVAGPLTFTQEAANYRSLIHYLGLERAHVVGHSASAAIALQIALDVPDGVQSIVLMEPALLAVVPSSPEMPQAVELYRSGDKAAAIDMFLRATCGPDGAAALERALPGARNQFLASADTFFRLELPALRQFSFGPDEARRITQPVLAVLGANSGETHRRRYELLLAWLPDVEPFILPDAGHLLHLQNHRGMVQGMTSFFARHPLAVMT